MKRGFAVAGFVLALALAFSQSGCSSASSSRKLAIFAAASLARPVEEIAASFSKNSGGVVAAPTFAGSQILLAQLGQGARADILATASPKEMETARGLGLIRGEGRIFARNSIALVRPARGAQRVQQWVDLAGKGVRLAMAGPAVPAGAYARNLIGRLAGMPQAGGTFAEDVMANVVSEDEDVTHVVAKVALGEVDAGFVYASDAQRQELVRVDLPAGLNEEVLYLAAVVAGTADPALAGTFVEYLVGPEPQAILEKYGFGKVADK